MKKSLLLLVLCSVFLLVGCGSNNESKMTCTLSQSYGDYEINFHYDVYYDGKYVTHIESEEIIISTDESILDYLEETINEVSEEAKVYGGYTFDLKRSNNKIVSTTKTDYSKMNLSKLQEDEPTINYIEDGKVTLDGIKSMYMVLGIKCN